MATASPMQLIFTVGLRKPLSSISGSHLIPRFFSAIFRRLFSAVRLCCSGCSLWRRASTQGKVETSSSGSNFYPTRPLQDSHETQLDVVPYTVYDGETIATKDAACSSYPYAGSIRTSARSMQNLQAISSVHSLNVPQLASRSPSPVRSRSSSRIGSVGSRVSSRNTSSSNLGYELRRSPSPIPLPEGEEEESYPHINIGVREPTVDEFDNIASPRPRRMEPNLEPIDGIPPHESTRSTFSAPSIVIPSTGHTSSTRFFRCLNNDHIKPTMPEDTKRYQKGFVIRRKCTNIPIEPMTTSFFTPDPPEWTRIAHPEGARYFYNETKRIYTDADLYDAKIFDQAKVDIEAIETSLCYNQISLENRHLVLDLNYDPNGNIETTYYFADHFKRVIFFLDQFQAEDIATWGEAPGSKSVSHLGYEIQTQYWYFLQLYPDSNPCTRKPISELRDVALHFIGDTMTCPTSTSPYTLDDLHKILKLTSQMEKNLEPGLTCIGTTSIMARLMYTFVRGKFIHFHGEGHARVERHNSVYGTPRNQRTLLIRTFSMFLFSAPDVHLRTLQGMWVDEIMHKCVWEQSVKKMNDEWQEFVLFGTIMLGANVAFLSIQSVDTDGTNKSLAQISSYLSIVASLGSIILGLLLIRQNRTKHRETADEVLKFLLKRKHPLLGLETLAILHSLPYALLMWGVVAFVAAVSFMCFQASNTETRVVVGPFCVAVLTLIIWCITSGWETQELPSNVTNLRPIIDDESIANSEGTRTSMFNSTAVNPSSTSYLFMTISIFRRISWFKLPRWSSSKVDDPEHGLEMSNVQRATEVVMVDNKND